MSFDDKDTLPQRSGADTEQQLAQLAMSLSADGVPDWDADHTGIIAANLADAEAAEQAQQEEDARYERARRELEQTDERYPAGSDE